MLILNIYFRVSSIFKLMGLKKGPTCDNRRNLFVTTLGAKVFNLDCLSGEINWSIEIDKPTFTSPIFNQDHTGLFFGTCGCQFYRVNFDGQIVRKF